MSSDYTLGATIYYAFTTRAFSTGVPTVLAGSPTLEIYENDSVTPIVEGVGKLVLTVSLNSIAGFNLATITATSGNGFESGKDYHIIIKTGTVGGTSVVGEVVGRFSIEKQSADVVKWLGTAAATPTVAGVPEVDVTHWIGTAAATPTVAGVPEVDVTHFNGTAGTFASGRPEVNSTHWAGSAITATSIPVGTAAGASGGLLISGSNAGTTTLGALTVTGATTLTGAVSLGSTLGVTGATTFTGAVTGTNASNDLRVNASLYDGSSRSTFELAIAAAVWQTAVAGNFTVASSIGKCLYINNVAPGGSGGLLISGTNAGTTTLGALTVTGATTLSGAVSFGSTWGITGSTTWTGDWILEGNTDMREGISFKRTANRAAINIYGSTTATTRGALYILAQAAGVPAIEIETTTNGDGIKTTLGTGELFPDNTFTAAQLSADTITAAKVASDVGTEIGTAAWASATRTLTAGTNIQLPSNGLDLVTAWTVNITGNLSGSVGSVTTKTGYSLASTGLDLIAPAEPSAVPTFASTTLPAWVAWIGAFTRNKVTETSTTQLLRNAADSATLGTSTVSDDGTTYTRGTFS